MGKLGAIDVPNVSIEVIQTKEEPKEIIKIEKVKSTSLTTPNSITNDTSTKVSAFSLASIKQKKELADAQKLAVRETVQYPTEPFNETDMLLHWNKFAQRLEEKGQMIMHTLMLMNDPKLVGTKITHELANEGNKLEFESTKNEVLGYLRGKLHNHDIEIELIVNEKMENKRAFTPQDKFNRMNQINPNLEILRKIFDLDV